MDSHGNTFSPEQMVVITHALAYTHNMKRRAYKKAVAKGDGEAAAAHSMVAANAIQLFNHIAEHTDAETRAALHEMIQSD